MISRLLQLKVLLPAIQAVLAIALWLYIPVQYRTELLQFSHMPADHPYRIHVPKSPQYFPPTCEQVLCVLNFPAFAVSRGFVDRLIYQYEYSQQASFPELEFTLPISDPAALPPRRIYYFVHVGEAGFLGLIILLWCWVGSRVDEYLRLRKGVVLRRARVLRRAELVILVLLTLFLIGFAVWDMPLALSPHALRIDRLGLTWPVVLLAYIWRAVRRERQQSSAVL